jgi:hypothetical protein
VKEFASLGVLSPGGSGRRPPTDLRLPVDVEVNRRRDLSEQGDMYLNH